jgi:hypothetical protein
MSETNTSQQEIPIQPVEDPILSSPYEEPEEHWLYDEETGEPSKQTGRRPAFYFNEDPATDTASTPESCVIGVLPDLQFRQVQRSVE